jgi:hypothetical protein
MTSWFPNALVERHSTNLINPGSVSQVITALPPDVRRWLCPAVEMPFTFLGYALGAAFGPINPKI